MNSKLPKVGAARSKSYSESECQVVAMAMLTARRNPLGVVKSDQFHDLFFKEYQRTRHASFPERSVNSLLAKWSEISASVQKFKGNYRR